MKHARLNIYTDFAKTIFASLLVGLIWSATAMLLVLILARNASAADAPLEKIERLGDAKEGRLIFKTRGAMFAAPTLKTDVHMRITGMIARVQVTQHFKNSSPEWMEGVYVFPLPEQSAVDHLKMTIGERVIEGQVKERDSARRTYETAKQEGKKTTLIEQERANIFTTSVANIGPQEEVSIDIQYQETLRYDQGQFSIRFPMVVAPRYNPGTPDKTESVGTGWSPNTTQVADASRITPPVLHPSQGSINPVSISVELDAGFPLAKLESPYHKIDNQKLGDNRHIIKLADNTTPAHRDFELVWKPQIGSAPQAAVFTETKQDKTYALVMVMPPETNTGAALQPFPREVIYVIDTSGSMSGTSMEQARAALKMALSRLTPRDQFNVIQFSSNTSQLYPQAVPVNARTLDEAQQYVGFLHADGGTEMADALNVALNNSDNPKLLRQVIFMTDGSVGNEDELFKIIRAKLGDSRLFTVGIGSAPNSFFMSKAAEFGHGTFTYIGKIEEVGEKMTALFQKLENPVLTNISINLPGVVEGEIWPKRVADLYAGEPVMLSAMLTHTDGEMVVTGNIGANKWQSKVSLAENKTESGVAVVWARKKITTLMDNAHDQPDTTKLAVIQVALDHHLVSKYTSLVAVDVTPVRPADQLLKTGAMPTNLPEGWNHEAVFGQLPKTATAAELNLLIGLMLVLLAAGVAWRGKRGGVAR